MLDNGFIDMRPKVQATEEKKLHQNEKICVANDTSKKVNIQ